MLNATNVANMVTMQRIVTRIGVTIVVKLGILQKSAYLKIRRK